jgi:hypothetical protein
MNPVPSKYSTIKVMRFDKINNKKVRDEDQIGF